MRETSYISSYNLGVIFGISPDTMNRLVKLLNHDEKSFNLGKRHQQNIRKSRVYFDKIFDSIGLREGKLIARGIIDSYINLRYTRLSLFTTKFAILIDEYTDFGVLTEQEIMREKLGISQDTFIRGFRQSKSVLDPGLDEGPRSEELNKYFNLLIAIYRINKDEFGFKNPEKFNEFRTKITQLTYQTLIDPDGNKLIKDHNMGGQRFYTVCLVLDALTKVKALNPKAMQSLSHAKNPHGFFTLKDLSEEISPKGYKALLNEQFLAGTPSHQLGNIENLLNFGIHKGIKECSIALSAVNKYLEREEKTASRMGITLHPLCESLDIQYLQSKNTHNLKIRAAHEKLMVPHGTHPDTIIERSDAFRKQIENHQSIINIPEMIKLLTIDHTISSDPRAIRQKLGKFYQSTDRFLIIVIWGHKSDNSIRILNDMLQDAIDNDDGSNHFENVKILTSNEYKEFLGFDGNFAKTFDRYQKFSDNIFRSMRLYNDVVRQSRRAKAFLDDLDEDWINIYLPQ